MIVDGAIFSCAALAVFIPLRKRYDKRGFFLPRIGFGPLLEQRIFSEEERCFLGRKKYNL